MINVSVTQSPSKGQGLYCEVCSHCKPTLSSIHENVLLFLENSSEYDPRLPHKVPFGEGVCGVRCNLKGMQWHHKLCSKCVCRSGELCAHLAVNSASVRTVMQKLLCKIYISAKFCNDCNDVLRLNIWGNPISSMFHALVIFTWFCNFP